ncbi:hypothetical protein TSAR_002779 [Trichomalopsis sarcophagae]|uniref:Methuselah N-terminal domain-containing protein n=1 Tax=Trichomalopsis sarcophagae TaxID=543379 RepID=A0A232FJN0_9HYME|nr:hypothetical protein TSAR_002779 [Trichomalopsis sarcophagae]
MPSIARALLVLALFGLVAAEQPCHELVSISLENATEVFANGSVLFDGLTFPSSAQYRDEYGQLRGCPCLVKRCIRFCCQPGEFYDRLVSDQPGSCYKPLPNETIDDFDLPPLLEDKLDPTVNGYEDFYRIHRYGCLIPVMYIFRLSEPLRITADGLMVVERIIGGRERQYIYEQDRYCIAYSRVLNSTKIMGCRSATEAEKQNKENVENWSYTSANWLSVIFLVATFVVYALFKKLRNLPGMTLMSYVACLAVAYAVLPFIRQTQMQNDLLYNDNVCKTIEPEEGKPGRYGLEGSCAFGGSHTKPDTAMPSTTGVLLVLLTFGLVAAEQPCHELVSVSLENATEVFADGSVLFDGLTFPNASQYRDESGQLRGCPCLVMKCIRFCCQAGEFHDKLHKDRPGLCYKPSANETADEEFDLPPLPDGILDPEVSGYDDFYRIHRKGCVVPAQYGIYLSGRLAKKSDMSRISADGHFVLENTNTDGVKTNYTHEQERYCVAYSRIHNTTKILACNSPAEDSRVKMENAMRWSETAANWLSVIFLVATFAVYSLFSSLRNLHGKTLMAYVACLTVAYAVLPFIKHAEIQNNILSDNSCKAMGMRMDFILGEFFGTKNSYSRKHEIQV